MCRVTLAPSKTIVLWSHPPAAVLLSMHTPHRLLVMEPALILPMWIIAVDQQRGMIDDTRNEAAASSSANTDERFARVQQIEVRPLLSSSVA